MAMLSTRRVKESPIKELNGTTKVKNSSLSKMIPAHKLSYRLSDRKGIDEFMNNVDADRAPNSQEDGVLETSKKKQKLKWLTMDKPVTLQRSSNFNTPTELPRSGQLHSRKGNNEDYTVVLPQKPNPDLNIVPQILKPRLRKTLATRNNGCNQSNKIINSELNRHQSSLARLLSRQNVSTVDQTQPLTDDISFSVFEPNSPIKSFIMKDYEELPSQRRFNSLHSWGHQNSPTKVDKKIQSNDISIQNALDKGGDEIDRSPFQEGDRLPRISSNGVNLRPIQNVQQAKRSETQSSASAHRIYGRNNSVGQKNEDQKYGQKPIGIRKSMTALTPLNRRSYKENALPRRNRAYSGRLARFDQDGLHNDDGASIARLSISLADTLSIVRPKSNPNGSRLVTQNASENDTMPRYCLALNNHHSVYDYGNMYLNSSSETPSTWSQLERAPFVAPTSHNNIQEPVRLITNYRNPSRQIPYLRQLEQSSTDESLSTKTVPIQSFPRNQHKNGLTETRSMNHLKSEAYTNRPRIYNTNTLPHIPLKNQQQNTPVNDYSLFHFKKLLATEVNSGDPRPFFNELGTIGEGSTSVVKLARYLPDNALIAIKKMKIANQRRPELLINEALLMRSFTHPNIVKMYSSYMINNEVWVIMEFMDCGALTSVLSRTRLNEKQVATICIPILSALAFIHSNGIIHRDIKSDSILLASDGRVKLSDFGFCATLTTQCPRRKSLVGTPYWMAPEVISRSPYNTSVDIWSFGVLVIEMIDGEPSLFDKPPSVAMQLIRERFVPHLKHPESRSRELLDFLNAALTRNEARRAPATQLLNYPFLHFAGPSSCLRPLFRPIIPIETN